jgi:hypothetical protein
VIAVQSAGEAVVNVSCVAIAAVVERVSRAIEAKRDFILVLLVILLNTSPIEPRRSIFLRLLKSTKD